MHRISSQRGQGERLTDFGNPALQSGTVAGVRAVDRDGMKHATTRMIYAYWNQLRGGRAAPERGEIDPGEIRHALGDTFILEAPRGGSASVRLAGTRLCALFGHELKGRAFESFWAPNTAGDPDTLIELVVNETVGCIAGLVGRTYQSEPIHLEMILLPLRHQGKPHARLLGAIAPLAVPSWIGLRPLESLATLSMRVIPPPGSGAMPAPLEHAESHRRAPLLTVHQGGRA